MRTILAACFIFFSIPSFSQTYNTKIEKAGTVKIYGKGKVEIGQIIINETTYNPKIFLDTSISYIDTLGNNIVELKLITQPGMPFFNVNIILEFSEPVEEVNADYTGIGAMEQFGYSKDKKAYQYKAGQVTASDLTLRIISKKKIFTNVYGVIPK